MPARSRNRSRESLPEQRAENVAYRKAKLREYRKQLRAELAQRPPALVEPNLIPAPEKLVLGLPDIDHCEYVGGITNPMIWNADRD